MTWRVEITEGFEALPLDDRRRRRSLWPGARGRGSALRLALVGLAAVVLWRLANVVLLLFFAVLIATVIRGVADALAARLRAPAGLVLALVALLLAAAACAALYWIGPAVAGQASDLVTRLVGLTQTLRSHYGHTPIGRAISGRLFSPQGLEGDVTSYFVVVAGSTLRTAGELFAVLVVSLYLAASPDMYVEGTVRLVPPRHRKLARQVLDETGHDLRRWLLGQLVDMLTVGGLAAVGLYLLGVPVPFALATLAGLLTIVPYFGALAAGIPGVLVAMTQSWMMALWVVVIFTICHLVEGYVVGPLVQHRLINMPPAVILLAMTIMATLFGPLGVVLGTPVAVAAVVVVRRVYLEHILGDHGAAAVP